MTAQRPRVLSEDWLPIAELGIESRREAAPIPGQFPKIKTLHLWWARRPLAASAGVVLGSLMPAWSSALPDAFPDEPRVASDAAYRRWFLRLCGVWGDAVKARAISLLGKQKTNPYTYKQAFKNSPNPDDLSLLHRLLEYTWGEIPTVIDPTAGGGSIPYEAARYGLPSIANDLNHVAAAVLRAGVEVPAVFGPDLVSDLRSWGERLVSGCEDRLAPYFKLEAQNERVTGYLFARTVICPRTGKMSPLAPNWWLNKEKGKEAAVRVIADRDGLPLDTAEFEVVLGPEVHTFDPGEGTVAGGHGISIWDGLAIGSDHIKAEARSGRLGSTLYAVAVRLPSGNSRWRRTYRAPTAVDLRALDAAETEAGRNMTKWLESGIVPSDAIPEGHKTSEPLRYGMTYWRDMFSARQLLVHATFVEEYQRLLPELMSVLGEARGKAVAGILGLMQGKALNYNARQAIWDYTGREKIAQVFSLHGFPFKYAYAEFDGARALFPWVLDQIVDSYEGIAALYAPGTTSYSFGGETFRGSASGLKHPVPGPVTVLRANAGNLDRVGSASQTLVCIDPPYYDNVMYGELSDFFGVWEQHTVGRVWPDVMPGGLADVKNEAVANPGRFKQFGRRKQELASQDYEAKMQAIFEECNRVLRDEGVLSVMFTHKRSEAWDTLGMALMEAGFSIETSWPVKTESESSMHQAKKNAASSTVMLVCRKRPSGVAGTIFFEDIESEVRATAREKAKEFADAGFAGVDLLLATYGPALSVISRHWPVMSSEVGPDGSARRLRPEEALDAAREEIIALRRQALVGRVIDFDPLTDFVVLAWSMFKAEEFPYDEARRLALAVGGNDVEALAAAKILTKKAGTVVLAKPSDRRKRIVTPLLEGQTAGLPLVDVLHGVMVIADGDGLSAAKALCDRLGLTRFDGQLDYAAEAALGGWMVASYSTGERKPSDEWSLFRLKNTST